MPFAIEPSTEISNRVDFSLLCNARGYIDAVEVGVDHGVFAAEFLSRFHGNWLVLVDPYEPYPEMPYDRTCDRLAAVSALSKHLGRFRFVGARSPECVPWVCTFITPQFVYLDGAHDLGSVAADIVGWWMVLAPGGILAGHDYDDDHPDVKAAVQKFAAENDVVVRLTHEELRPSWYVYKGEPERLCLRLFNESTQANPHYQA